MNKIFMIGKFNVIFQDINSYLGKYFNVQVCVDNLEMVKGMLKLNTPELIVISLIGMEIESGRILSDLKYNHSNVPVLCIGTEGEQSNFKEFFKQKQFHVLTRPVNNERILETICEILQLGFDKAGGIVLNKKFERKSILLVDDNAIQLRSLNEMLKEKYDVQMATSGMKALTLIGRRVPDVIFLDYEMPMCDGKMTLQMIREVDEAKDVPVVFLTGVRDKEHIKAVLDLHPAGYILKPASVEKIFETLDKIFEADTI